MIQAEQRQNPVKSRRSWGRVISPSGVGQDIEASGLAPKAIGTSGNFIPLVFPLRS
jgi:hypothetical protein